MNYTSNSGSLTSISIEASNSVFLALPYSSTCFGSGKSAFELETPNRSWCFFGTMCFVASCATSITLIAIKKLFQAFVCAPLSTTKSL